MGSDDDTDDSLVILRWWGGDGTLGQADDSLLLLDYFGTASARSLPLNIVLRDLHLWEPLEAQDLASADAYFVSKPGFEPHFDIAVGMVLDLAAIVLECAVNDAVSFRALDPSSAYPGTIEVVTTGSADGLLLLLGGLDWFAVNPQSTELADLLSADELSASAQAAIEIAAELRQAALS